MKYNGFLIFAALLRICFSNLRKAEAYELYLHRTERRARYGALRRLHTQRHIRTEGVLQF